MKYTENLNLVLMEDTDYVDQLTTLNVNSKILDEQVYNANTNITNIQETLNSTSTIVNNFVKEEDYSMERTGKDNNNQFATVTFKDSDGHISMIDTLSGLDESTMLYSTRTLKRYEWNSEKNVNELKSTKIYTLTYDEDGDCIKEELVNV